MTAVQRTEGSPRIAFTDEGEGETALLLFTGWCSSRQRWSEVAPRLARHHRVVSFEWRGHGESDRAPGDFGNADMVEDALAVIEATGLSSFVPCTASHSGWVAIELFRRCPDRVPALIHLDWMVVEPSSRYSAVIDQLTSPEEWAQARDTLFEIWRAGVEEPRIDRAFEAMEGQGAEMWMRSGREIGSAYSRNQSPLAAWSTLPPPLEPPPILHLYGQPVDPEYLAVQQEFAVEHPWFQVSHLEAVSHFSMLETPAAVEAAMVGFLAEQGLDRAEVR
ncbi:MAG: alpha/beta hydrolase [Actinobacteria bacterium]|nr:alpha/beta hydrolase [Actinomycetota bacterium]